jgi:hypothetical protein
MKKKAPIRKKAAAPRRTNISTAKRKQRRPEARASKSVVRTRRSEVREAPAEPGAETPEIVAPKPEARKPMPVELARMLEEETWWRVVPAGIPAAPVRAEKFRMSASTVRTTLVSRGSCRC